MILSRSLGGVASIGYVERGPVWRPGDSNAMRLSMEALSHAAHLLRFSYLALTPPYAGDELGPILDDMKFYTKPESLPPSGVGRATLIVDLHRTLDDLLADMSMTKRQNLRRGARKGVQVRLGDGRDADTMRDLMWSSCRRRGISPSPPQRDFFEKFWSLLGPAGYIKFFIVEIEGKPVSAACVLTFGGSAQLWRVGWSGEHEKSNPNDVLHWEMIKWAKEHGYRDFDLMHIRPDHARALLQGQQVRDSYSGVTEFKMSFGGDLRLLPEVYYRSFHPVLHAVCRLGGARLVASRAARQMIRKAAHIAQAL